MSHTPQISLIIAIGNITKYLDACLDSVKRQTFQDFEVIFVLSPKLKSQHFEFELSNPSKVVYDSGQGLGEARNLGLQEAQGKYIAFLDSDDCLAPDMLEKLWIAAEKQKVDLVFCQVQPITEKGVTCSGSLEYDLPNLQLFKTGEVFNWKNIPLPQLFCHQNCVVVWNKLYRREFLEQHHIHFLPTKRFEDNMFYYEGMLRANRICVVWEKLYFYRQRHSSLSHSILSDKNAFEIIGVWEQIAQLPSKLNIQDTCVYEALVNHQASEYTHYYLHISREDREQFVAEVKKLANPKAYETFLRNLPQDKWQTLLGIPIIRVKGNYWSLRYYLFGFIPILKVQHRNKKILKLFNFIKI